jgi:hypothetical protein
MQIAASADITGCNFDGNRGSVSSDARRTCLVCGMASSIISKPSAFLNSFCTLMPITYTLFACVFIPLTYHGQHGGAVYLADVVCTGITDCTFEGNEAEVRSSARRTCICGIVCLY